MALVGRSTSDVRDILILGESGVLTVIDPDEAPEYKPSVRRVIWPNGSEAMTFTADIPDQLRGPQFHYAFGDELGSWRVKATGGGMVNAWSQLQIATRLGEHPQIYIATTPRRVPMILDVVRMADEKPDEVLLVRGSTFANRHLGAAYKDAVTGLYEGTTLGQQELEGELLSDVDGALLNMSDIQDNKLLELGKDDTDGDELNDIPPSYFWEAFPHRIIGVDPSVSAQPNDECGIVACAASSERKMYKRQGYVLEDASILGTPEEWAKVVVAMARKYRAVVVAEDNQGGEMVKMVIQAADPRVPVTLVRSAAGKLARAEPVAMAYQQGRIHHTDDFNMLEDQLTSWAPDTGQKSPDRMDALVHAMTALLVVKPKKGLGQISIGANSSGRHLGSIRDHDPLTPMIPGAVGGDNRRAMLHRLARVEGVNIEEYLGNDEDEMDEGELVTPEMVRRIRRTNRLQVGPTRNHGPEATLFGAPNQYRRF